MIEINTKDTFFTLSRKHFQLDGINRKFANSASRNQSSIELQNQLIVF